MTTGNPEMHLALEREAGCRATFVTSQTIVDHLGDMEFARAVSLFTLTGHEKAKKAYVWQIESTIGKTPEYKVVLGQPPINSAEDAVRSAVKNITKRIMESADED